MTAGDTGRRIIQEEEGEKLDSDAVRDATPYTVPASDPAMFVRVPISHVDSSPVMKRYSSDLRV
jgi:hypothetical protein